MNRPAAIKRPAAHNAAFAATAEILGKVSTLAWTVVAARVLSQAQFGSFNLALALALIVSAVAEGGFDPVLMVKGSRDRANLATYHTQAIAWQVAIAVPTFLLAGGLTWLTRPTLAARAAVAFVLAAVFLDLWSDTARASASAAQDQSRTSRALVLQRLCAAVLIIPALLAGLGLAGMAAGFLLASAIGWVAHVRALGRLGVAFRPWLVHRAQMRAFARGSWILGLSGLVAIALFRVDALILAALRGDRAVGQYAAAYRLFETVLFLVYSVSGAVVPVMSVRSRDPAEVRRLGELALAALAAIYLPFAVVCLVDGRAVLELLYGARYGGATAALGWLSLAPLAYAAGGISGAILVVGHRLRGVLAAAAAALAVNLTLNLLLIPSLGGTAAGMATTVAEVVQAVLSLGFAGALVGRLRIWSALAEPIVAGAALALVLLALPLGLPFSLPLGLVIYVLVWFALVRRRRPALLGAVTTLLPGRGRAPA